MGIFSKKRQQLPARSRPGTFHCSFCNKNQHQVRKLIAGPGVYICDECTDICLDILARERTERDTSEVSGTAAWPSSATSRCSLCGRRTPAESCLTVRARGALCPACTAEIQAALDESREDEPL